MNSQGDFLVVQCLGLCALVAEGLGSIPSWGACNAGDPGLILGLGNSPGEGNGNPLQYSYLENPMNRGAWGATVNYSPWLTKSWTQQSI